MLFALVIEKNQNTFLQYAEMESPFQKKKIQKNYIENRRTLERP